MNIDGKKVLLVGLAKTGISTVRYLHELGADLMVNDIKKADEFVDILNDLKDIDNVEYILGTHPSKIDDIDFAVVSPGVPLDLPFFDELRKQNKPILGEVELAYRLSNGSTFIGITGTNGKTTTTSLTGAIFKEAGKDTYIVGNIGNPVINAVRTAGKDSFLVTELSSFQLESVEEFKPHVSAVLNISEDHLNRHHTMENYINAKFNVFKNQDSSDYCIFNYDDETLRNSADRVKTNLVWFSTEEKVNGVYALDGDIYVNIDGFDKVKLMKVDELSLPGKHNLANALAAIAMAWVEKIPAETVIHVLKTFKPVEHRLEYVDSVKGVKFVNDSKGTNPDSTMKAVTSYKDDIILIAGGYDKDSSFDELMELARKTVKLVVTMGQTADKVKEAAEKQNIKVLHATDMKDAVQTAFINAKESDVVLLSPACASWGMYKNYEERGKDFKNNVALLKSINK